MACYLTWRRKATKSGRSYFQLAPSTPRTGGIGFGLWPTPAAHEPGWKHIEGKDEGSSATAFRGEIQAIRRGNVHAVLVCVGHMSHSAFGEIKKAAASSSIPWALTQRPTKRTLVESIRELVGRLPR
jgi:hypothetical protein